MMLQRLLELAQREQLVGRPGYAPEKISFRIIVPRGGGKPTVVDGRQATTKGQLVGRLITVPRSNGRTSIGKPNALWDSPAYVFGVDPDEARDPDELELMRTSFAARTREIAEVTNDEAVGDLVRTLEYLAANVKDLDGLLRLCNEKSLARNDNFAFEHADDPNRLITERLSVIACLTPSTKNKAGIMCLASGQPGTAARKHPLLKNLSDKQVPLISFKPSASHSYGLKGNANAPISEGSSEAIAAALNRLLADFYPNPVNPTERLPCRRLRIAPNSALLFWCEESEEAADCFGDALQDPNKVAFLFKAMQTGKQPAFESTKGFYALALAGEIGRAKVRSWFETTVRDALGAVRQHFEDTLVVSGREHPHFPLWRMLQSLAPLGDSKRLPPRIAAELTEAVITNRPYPKIVLDQAVRRIRVEKEKVPPERAALIKGYLLRLRRHRSETHIPEVKPDMDPTITNVAYRLGRLFAVLERAQEDAVNPQATIRDRYFASASATPVLVFPRLLRGAQPHLSKARSGSYFQKLIGEILDPVEPLKAFPGHLTLEEQGLFAVGYFQQRQAFFAKRETTTPPNEV